MQNQLIFFSKPQPNPTHRTAWRQIGSRQKKHTEIRTAGDRIVVEEVVFKEYSADQASEIDPANFDTMSIRTDVSDDDMSVIALICRWMTFCRPKKQWKHLLLMIRSLDDRHYKRILLSSSTLLITIQLNVIGKIRKIFLLQELGLMRGDVYKSIPPSLPPQPASDPQIQFTFSSPADQQISILNLNASRMDLIVEDEIVSHLSAWIQDDQPTPNKLRLQVQVNDSQVEIRDKFFKRQGFYTKNVQHELVASSGKLVMCWRLILLASATEN
ncbi:unnamed protein product, partial [Mesorhabditis spiculigera]